MQTFETKKAVIQFLEDLVNQGFLYPHEKGHSETGTCILVEGEYSSPDYIPTRYKDGWAIKVIQHYHIGTFHMPTNGRVDMIVYTSNDEFTADLLEILPVDDS